MKTTFVVASLFLLFWGCQKELSNPVNDAGPNANGRLSLTFDKTNMPQAVVRISAILSRSGFQTLTKNMNVLSDSSAEVLFENIVVGVWNLQVNAFNSDSVVIYSGKTDVTVLEGVVTRVALVLQPVSSGTGSIRIFVTWGTGAWVDFPGNPVMRKLPQDSSSSGVQVPHVLYENGTHKMWFTIRDINAIAYATSVDGITWSRHEISPVLTKGNPDDWDGQRVAAGVVIHDSLTYKMYYYGTSSHLNGGRIGLATSSDGIHWQKHGSPVLIPTSGAWDQADVGQHSVVKTDSGYFLYYHGMNNNYVTAIGLAYSSDGIHWEKHPNNPIMNTTETWEGDLGIYFPSVIFDQGLFKMVYMSRNSLTGLEAFGFATSVDGVFWAKSNSNPFFTLNMTSNHWAATGIAHPFYGKLGSEYRIYYTGDGVNGNLEWGIGLLREK